MTIRTLIVAVCAWSVYTQGVVPSRAFAQSASSSEQLLHDGQALRDKGDFKSALPIYHQAVAIAEHAHDDVALARALAGYGACLWGTGDYAGAVQNEDRALSLVRRSGDVTAQALLLNDSGLSLYSMGRYEDALARYSEALQLLARAPSVRTEGLIRANIGLVYRYEGRFDAARESLQVSVRLRREAGDIAGVGQSLNHLGMLSRARGQFDKSLAYYRESLELRQRTGDRQGQAQTLNNMANVFADLGDTEAAIDNYTNALEISEQIGYRVQVALSHANIARLLEDAGRLPDALSRLESALADYRAMNRRSQTADTLRNIGRVRMKLGRFAAAHTALDEALPLTREIKEPETEALVLQTQGNLAFAERDVGTAIVRLSDALAIARSVGDPEIEWDVLADRGRALREARRVDEAIADFRASTAIVNDLRAHVSTDAGRIGLFDSRRQVFYWLADTLATAGRGAEALEVAEASRARAFADLLGQRSVAVKAADTPGLERVRDAVAELSAAAAAPIRRTPETSSGSIDAALKTVSGELASLVTVQSPSFDEIRQQASRLGATFLEYMVTADHLLAWVVAPDGGVHGATIDLSAARLETLVREARRDLEPNPSTLRHPERATAALRAIDEAVIEPVAAWLPGDPEQVVIVIPDGPLAYVPFGALTDQEGEPLVARHVLASAPSISVFRYTAEKRNPDAPLRALVVADPTLPTGANLPPIPWSRSEAEEVRRRIGPTRVKLLEGSAASEAAVKKLSHDRTILHFATHGLVSAERPLATSLVLGAGGGDDGYLRVSEVLGLDLRANLVVLSGCSTGLGRLSSDGFVGLTRAFIYAGTPTVVVSQWDVSDRATSVLMDRFYAELTRGQSPAEALRAASLATRRQFPHPALWAAFQVVGEPR